MMEDVDLVLMPGAFHVAARLDDPAGMTAYTADTAMTPFNMSGHPALSFCTGFDGDGLPTSAQLVGRTGSTRPPCCARATPMSGRRRGATAFHTLS